jgi:hypothetical protein
MNALYTILLFIGGIGLIVLGIWLCLKEMKTWSKWYNDKWTIGNIQGLGVACIGIGIVMIALSFGGI